MMPSHTSRFAPRSLPLVHTRHTAQRFAAFTLWICAALVTPAWGDETPADRTDTSSDAAGIEFFESKIRPLLVQRCYDCHGEDVQEANLRLDSREAMLRGGKSGPVVKPGEPDASLLVAAIQYQTALQMPPDGKLSLDEISLLLDWIGRGAPAPAGAAVAAPAVSDFDWQQRLDHWCYRPLTKDALPSVTDPGWPCGQIDQFVLARLEGVGLAPSPPAERSAWLRRVTYDLTGLPPTVDELQEFLERDTPEAAQQAIDRLLASPRYGERWGRHWLDLVRFAETLGHEFDYDIFHSWRYRDYVVQALNNDLPYDQFVREHLAGDLLPAPRRDPLTGANQSIVATGFFWLGEGKHSPVDVRQEETDRVDNQIDVLGKAFLAQTLACARCHDHKFDAISAEDYYALFGYVKSSRYQQAFLGGPPQLERDVAELAALRSHTVVRFRRALAKLPAPSTETLARYLQVAVDAAGAFPGGQPPPGAIAALAQKHRLEPARLRAWLEALTDPATESPRHPLYVLRAMALPKAEDARTWTERRAAFAEQAARQANETAAATAQMPDLASLVRTGQAFAAPTPLAAMMGTRAARPVLRLVPATVVHSAALAPELEGDARSDSFALEAPYLHVLAAGKTARLNVVVDGFTLIRDPVYGGLTKTQSNEQPNWVTFDVSMWLGHRAYLEFCEGATPNPTMPMGEQLDTAPRANDFFEVHALAATATPAPPPAPWDPSGAQLVQDPLWQSTNDLTLAYSKLLEAARQWWIDGGNEQDTVRMTPLVNVLLSTGMLDLPDAARESPAGYEPLRRNVAAAVERFQQIARHLPLPQRAPALLDDVGHDERVLVRGSYRRPADIARRRPPRLIEHLGSGQVAPEAPTKITASEALAPSDGSGRLELVESLLGPGRPLVARVVANRLWQHHFGRGLVATVDDFGRMGQPPTHPELLDWLAARLIEDGWSLKALHRRLLASATYAQSSAAAAEMMDADPNNLLWGRMLVRRLEAEAIRDTMLALADRLDCRVGGPGVAPFLTPFMEGTGRPAQSGPLDGAGRRSLYITVRRNFLTPLLVAFDYPVPFSTMGRRNQSNVPAQALALLNDPFVLESAGRWSQHSGRGTLDRFDAAAARRRLTEMYRQAFARPPRNEELAAALGYLAPTPGASPSTEQAWTDLAHMLLNVKELIYLP